jgi:hypothetical protein
MKNANAFLIQKPIIFQSRITKIEIVGKTLSIDKNGRSCKVFHINEIRKIFVQKECNKISFYLLIGVFILGAFFVAKITASYLFVLESAIICLTFLINALNTKAFKLSVCLNSGEQHAFVVSKKYKYKTTTIVKQVRANLKPTTYKINQNEFV